MSVETFQIWLAALAFVWGAVWGSFLNVVIYRLPEGLSLSKPPSRCPKCETPLAWYDNIPIFGWILLWGRCRYCKVPIPIRYPGVELLTAVLGLLLWLHFSGDILMRPMTAEMLSDVLLALGVAFFLYFFFIAVLIAITFIDLDRTIIPHELTGLGSVLGLVAVFAIHRAGPLADLWPMITWIDALAGGVFGAGIILTIIVVYKVLRGIEGMGGGDVTMMGMCGLWLGWRGVIFILFFASIQGVIAAIAGALYYQMRGEKVGDGGFFITDVDAIDQPPPDPAQPSQSGEPDGEAQQAPTTDEASAQADEASADQGAPATGEPNPDNPDEGDPEDKSFNELAVPFGPFIALAAIEYLLFGQWLLPLILDL